MGTTSGASPLSALARRRQPMALPLFCGLESFAMKCPGCGRKLKTSEVVSQTESKWPCIKCGISFTIRDISVSCKHCGEKMKAKCEVEGKDYSEEITCLECKRTFFALLPGPLLEGPFRRLRF